MIYSRSVEYALRALTHLALQPEGKPQKMAREIAEAEEIPAFFLAKTLQQLARKGILLSMKGPTGGFELNRPPKKISLMAVIEILDGTESFERCAVGLPECTDQTPCPIHDSFQPLRESIVRFLSKTTIADLAEELRRKQRAAARRSAAKRAKRRAARRSRR